MKKVDIFYQVEGLPAVHHTEGAADEQLGSLKMKLAAKHGVNGAEAALFGENMEEPLAESLQLDAVAGPHGAKLHLHRCHRIEVAVTFAGRTIQRTFGPGTTIAHVKLWAAETLGMTKEDASEHVLQLTGSHDRPTPSTHIGALVRCPACQLALDLVADERVNGAPGY